MNWTRLDPEDRATWPPRGPGEVVLWVFSRPQFGRRFGDRISLEMGPMVSMQEVTHWSRITPPAEQCRVCGVNHPADNLRDGVCEGCRKRP